MKKQAKKLKLAKETVRDLRSVVGAIYYLDQISCDTDKTVCWSVVCESGSC